MKIGILVPSIGNFGKIGFYNMQEIGHAKALSKLFSSVQVYKLVDRSQEKLEQAVEGFQNVRIHFLPSKQIGSNGLPDLSLIDSDLDALILCADTQLSVPYISRWAKRKGIRLIPYIGVTRSHSTGKIKKFMIDLLFGRNLAVYKKHHCAVKTPTVKAELERMGVPNVTVAPVGLDLSVLNRDYAKADVLALKQKYGYGTEDKVLLFIGRMIEEKQPLRMIQLFAQTYSRDSAYRLLMVGTGELKEAVAAAAETLGVAAQVQFIDRIPNKDIWELYRIADSFVNLNQQEIFGMAILEAMYYGCKVVAWKAPGPSFIIEDGVSGFLADSDAGILEAITERTILPEAAQERIINHFTWDKTAEKMLSLAERN